MDEGIFQLVFVLIFILASVLDGVTRGKRKRQRMEEPEDAVPPEGTAQRPSTPGFPTQGKEPPGRTRQTSDSMAPADLWAVLTGEQPPPTRQEGTGVPEAEPWTVEGETWTGEGVPWSSEPESTEGETWSQEATVRELPPAEPAQERIPDDEIEAIRALMASRMAYGTHPYLEEGMAVEVTRGPLEGLRGILVRKERRHRLVISVHLIKQAAAVEIDDCDVVPV